MARPSVDVVVPFRGTQAELAELCLCLAAICLAEGDSLVVVDNTAGSLGDGVTRCSGIEVVHAVAVSSPGYARNRGAERGGAEWIVFIDSDTVPGPDLLDSYFDPLPGDRTALLAGGVLDEPVPPRGRPAARYAHIRGLMGQENTFRLEQWSFPQTANVACRREAFAAAGGFHEEIRAAEDADLTFRLKASGWGVERREAARVVHRSRQTVRGLIAQRLAHGAGGAWLARQYPGSFPARRRPGMLWWGLRTAVRGLLIAAYRRDRDWALWALFEPLEHLSYEFGRSLRNEPR